MSLRSSIYAVFVDMTTSWAACPSVYVTKGVYNKIYAIFVAIYTSCTAWPSVYVTNVVYSKIYASYSAFFASISAFVYNPVVSTLKKSNTN
jgi:hypothetical protein